MASDRKQYSYSEESLGPFVTNGIPSLPLQTQHDLTLFPLTMFCPNTRIDNSPPGLGESEAHDHHIDLRIGRH